MQALLAKVHQINNYLESCSSVVSWYRRADGGTKIWLNCQRYIVRERGRKHLAFGCWAVFTPNIILCNMQQCHIEHVACYSFILYYGVVWTEKQSRISIYLLIFSPSENIS